MSGMQPALNFGKSVPLSAFPQSARYDVGSYNDYSTSSEN